MTRSARRTLCSSEPTGSRPSSRRVSLSVPVPISTSLSRCSAASRIRPTRLSSGRRPEPIGGTPGVRSMFTFGATAAVGRPECSAPAEAPVRRASTISTSGEHASIGIGQVGGVERRGPEEEQLADLAHLRQRVASPPSRGSSARSASRARACGARCHGMKVAPASTASCSTVSSLSTTTSWPRPTSSAARPSSGGIVPPPSQVARRNRLIEPPPPRTARSSPRRWLGR